MLHDNQVVQIQGVSYDTLLSNFKEIVKDEVKKFSQIKTETAEAPDRYIDTKEVCDLYDVSTVTVWEWEKKGLIKSYRIGNLKRFLLSEIMASPKLIQRNAKK
jgi:predicted DNA-binding transcriptional regulator AlpA